MKRTLLIVGLLVAVVLAQAAYHTRANARAFDACHCLDHLRLAHVTERQVDDRVPGIKVMKIREDGTGGWVVETVNPTDAVTIKTLDGLLLYVEEFFTRHRGGQ